MLVDERDPATDREAHVPVMRERVVEVLTDAVDGPFVDATLGAAGHASAVARSRAARYGHAHLIGIDRDTHALALAEQRLADLPSTIRVDLVHARFDALVQVCEDLGDPHPAAVLFDLGISSMHVDQPERGFSYRHEGPLDMRMDPTAPLTAATVVNEYAPADLVRVLREYGEERFADRIVRAIVAARPLTTTTELADIVRNAIPAAARRHGGHPATRTFQALRIEVNTELDALARVLPDAVELLVPGGVCAVLAYHSLEDRIVKRAFADAARGCICPPDLPVCGCGREPLVEHVIRRPERPDETETQRNPRASAARLRVVRRC